MQSRKKESVYEMARPTRSSSMSQATGHTRLIRTFMRTFFDSFRCRSAGFSNVCDHSSSQLISHRENLQDFHLSPMLPGLLIPYTTILSIVLCTLTLHGHTGARTHSLPRDRAIDGLDFQGIGPSGLVKPRAAIDPYFISPEWIVDHHDFICMLPIDTAAAILQDFYEDLAAFAAVTVTPAARRHQLYLGQILLEIMGPPGFVVSWIMVQKFALDMLRLTKRGYTNTYQINFIHRPTGRMFTFSLYVGL